jgi:hypothetical protein
MSVRGFNALLPTLSGLRDWKMMLLTQGVTLGSNSLTPSVLDSFKTLPANWASVSFTVHLVSVPGDIRKLQASLVEACGEPADSSVTSPLNH